MTSTPDSPLLASAAVLVREDGRVLLVRHPPRGPFAGMWTLPLTRVGGHETAEDAVERMLRETLHVRPGPSEFSDTIYVEGLDGARFVLNAFTSVGWEGEPRYSEDDYQDAAWVSRPPADMPLPQGLRDWFATAFTGEEQALDAAALDEELMHARYALVEAFEGVPEDYRAEAMEGEWSPLDVLAHAADVEAYYIAETRRLLEQPGHTWRTFNDAQWEDVRRARLAVDGPEDEGRMRARMEHVRAETRRWLATLGADDLVRYGNHPERGAVQVADRIGKVARHDREHLEQIRAMANAIRLELQAKTSGTDRMGGEPE